MWVTNSVVFRILKIQNLGKLSNYYTDDWTHSLQYLGAMLIISMIYIDILVSKMKGDPAGAANPSCRIIRNLLNLRSGFLCTLSSSCFKPHRYLDATTFLPHSRTIVME